jgi:hypothetical protein
MPRKPAACSGSERSAASWDAGRVYEWHGWATIKGTANASDVQDDPIPLF